MTSVHRRASAVLYLALVSLTALLTERRASAAQFGESSSALPSAETAPAIQYAIPHVQADVPINVIPFKLQSSLFHEDVGRREHQQLERAVEDHASIDDLRASVESLSSPSSSSNNSTSDEGTKAGEHISIVSLPSEEVETENTWEEALEAEQAWETNMWEDTDAELEDEKSELSVETLLGAIAEQIDDGADAESSENTVVVEVYQVATAAPASEPDREPMVVSESLEVSYFVPENDDNDTIIEKFVDEAMTQAAETFDASAAAAAVIMSEFNNYDSDYYYSNTEAAALTQPIGNAEEYIEALSAPSSNGKQDDEPEVEASVAAPNMGGGAQDPVERMLDDLEVSAMIVGALLSQQGKNADPNPVVLPRRGLRPALDTVAALQAVPVTETTAKLVVNIDLYRIAVIACILTFFAMIVIKWYESEVEQRRAYEEQQLPCNYQCCLHCHKPPACHLAHAGKMDSNALNSVCHDDKDSQTIGSNPCYAPVREIACQTKA